MTIHYHGTPITPRSELFKLAGRCFCVSFYDPRDADTCAQIGQSILFDNGAFTTFNSGAEFDEGAYYRWLEPRLAHPHFAVVPDRIAGSEDDQRARAARWPFSAQLGAPVWHMGLSIDYLLELSDAWPRLCFGSSQQYWQIGSEAWCRRADEAFDALARRHKTLPWVHMLRGLGIIGDRWPFASADSTNLARNHKGSWRDNAMDLERRVRNIDAVNGPTSWEICTKRNKQGVLI